LVGHEWHGDEIVEMGEVNSKERPRKYEFL